MNMHQLVDVVLKGTKESIKHFAGTLSDGALPHCEEPYKRELIEAIDHLEEASKCLEVIICRDAWERRGEKS